jgi:hypothetical protein
MITDDQATPGDARPPSAADFRALATQIRTVHDDLKRNRHLLWGAVAFILAAGVILAYGSSVAQCQSSNRVRTEQTALWRQALPVIVNHTDPDWQQDLAELQTQVRTDFATRNCLVVPVP